jgi:TonB family protein
VPEPPRREPEPAAPAYREPPPSKPWKRADKRGRREATGDVFAPPPPLPTPAPPAAASPVATQRVEAARAQAPRAQAPRDQVPRDQVPRDQAPRDVPFGQYTLLERVAIGGMAEVWKARMRGVEGFQKTVAIKKILAHLTDSVDFVTMFIDEAKLAAQLNHPHIIHIYDLGKIDEDYYIAMEYVEGKDLRSILNTARREGTPMPLGLALLVASRLASALDYAHRKRDFDNRELGLVHRDVSPQNVLISYEGDIKLCDFGIAKAVAKASKTQMGALKGKLQYMSPEQAWGRVVDSRSDVFSLGAVLFEMLTGRRLFAGESEISVLESVREARTQSVRDVDPAIPEPVDAIVRRALAKDPDDRFQTAGEMQKEIDAILHSLRAGASQGDLAAFMHRLHAGEVAALSVAGTVAAAAPAPEAPGGEREVPAVVPIGEPAEPEARRRPWLIPAAAAAAALVALTVFLLTRGPSGANPGAEPAATGDGAPADAPQAVAAQPLPAAIEAVPPGAGAVPAAVPTSADLQQRVEDQLRAKQQQLEQQLETQRRELQAELQREAPAQPAPTKAAPAVAEAEPVETPAAVAPPPPPPPAETPVVVEERPAPRPPPRPAPALQEEPARPTVREGDLVAAGTPGLSPPGFVSFSKPEYPPLAKRLAVEGTVVVGVLVDESGQVQEARLVRGVSQNVGLNEAAVRAARTARYRPATMTGVRVKTWVNLTIPFKL